MGFVQCSGEASTEGSALASKRTGLECLSVVACRDLAAVAAEIGEQCFTQERGKYIVENRDEDGPPLCVAMFSLVLASLAACILPAFCHM
eukprot:TRINITY_DN93836_c0_g1_i1.p2 TRINITY_DN93836_c0_g1~~TRINITY_DN93836_c0_g1_i1.p2  ORF type:complete len:102 (+),score=13.64 TRINITY_DN93836_c0_g1_i1:37-306(+)